MRCARKDEEAESSRRKWSKVCDDPRTSFNLSAAPLCLFSVQFVSSHMLRLLLSTDCFTSAIRFFLNHLCCLLEES